MSNNPFEHNNCHVTWGLPRLAAIIERYGSIRADSERMAARTALNKLQCASKLGRSTSRREDRMAKIVGVGISLGLLGFKNGQLTLTSSGAKSLEAWREHTSKKPRRGEKRVHGKPSYAR